MLVSVQYILMRSSRSTSKSRMRHTCGGALHHHMDSAKRNCAIRVYLGRNSKFYVHYPCVFVSICFDLCAFRTGTMIEAMWTWVCPKNRHIVRIVRIMTWFTIQHPYRCIESNGRRTPRYYCKLYQMSCLFWTTFKVGVCNANRVSAETIGLQLSAVACI